MNDLEFLYKKSEYPSKDRSDYWIVDYLKSDYHEHTKFGGKWLIYCNNKTVDNTWLLLKDNHKKGFFGNVMKVATALSAMSYKGNHVICIYTYDSRDINDVMRIRDSLRDIGFTEPLKYKRDIETINNVYGTADEFLFTI